MIIKNVQAQEICNAQGFPTLSCTITLANNQQISSSIPSNFEQKNDAVLYKYDQEKRFFHKGMQQSAQYINDHIAPIFIDKPINGLAMDSALMDLDTSQNKGTIGGNTTLVVSICLFKAQAYAEGIELFELLQSISGTKQAQIPRPLFALLQGKGHNNQQEIKQFLQIPQEKSFQKNLEAAVMMHHHTKKALETYQQPTGTNESGAFITSLASAEDAFMLLEDVMDTIPQHSYSVGLNVNATNLYDKATHTYNWNNRQLTSMKLTDAYLNLLKQYPYITSLIDGMSESDTEGWIYLSEKLQNQISIVGDDIFCTNPMKIRKGVLQKISNTVVIKPEQIGTVSQTIAAIDACKNNDRKVMIAAIDGQTCDSFASDLAAGVAADYFLSGSPSQGEFITKYNRLTTIEKLLT